MLAADSLGKVKTVCQISTIVYLLLFRASTEPMFAFTASAFGLKPLGVDVLGTALIALSLLSTLVSGLNYLLNNRALLEDC